MKSRNPLSLKQWAGFASMPIPDSRIESQVGAFFCPCRGPWSSPVSSSHTGCGSRCACTQGTQRQTALQARGPGPRRTVGRDVSCDSRCRHYSILVSSILLYTSIVRARRSLRHVQALGLQFVFCILCFVFVFCCVQKCR